MVSVDCSQPEWFFVSAESVVDFGDIDGLINTFLEGLTLSHLQCPSVVHRPIIALLLVLLSLESAFMQHRLEFVFLQLVKVESVAKIMGRVAHSQFVGLFLDGVVRVALHVPFPVFFRRGLLPCLF